MPSSACGVDGVAGVEGTEVRAAFSFECPVGVRFRYAAFVDRLAAEFFFFNDTATTEIYTLSLHDALPIYGAARVCCRVGQGRGVMHRATDRDWSQIRQLRRDRGCVGADYQCFVGAG